MVFINAVLSLFSDVFLSAGFGLPIGGFVLFVFLLSQIRRSIRL